MSAGRLVVTSTRLDRAFEPEAVAGPGGVVWEGALRTIAGRGEATRIPLTEHPPGGAGSGGPAAAPAPGVVGAGAVVARLAGFERRGTLTLPVAALAALPFAGTAGGSLVVPAIQHHALPDGSRWRLEVTVGGEAPQVTTPPATDGAAPPSAFTITPRESHADWLEAVAAARDVIRAGELDKIVLVRAVDVVADAPLDVSALLRRLRAAYPTCYRFAIDGFVGASPELLVSRQGDVVRAQPMAGTVPRLGDPRADAQLAAQLLASAKDRHEHRLTIEAVHDALLPSCSFVDAEAEPTVVSVANVQHLASRVEGRLSRPLAPVLELVLALHPTPAVGGHPAGAADLLPRWEAGGRGRYAGPVGWMDAEGDGEWAVGIRAAEVDGRRARLYAGVGIVADSDPASELAETQAKLVAMLSAIVRP